MSTGYSTFVHVLLEFILATACVDSFDIFGEEFPMPHAEEVPEVVEVQPAGQPNGAAPRLNWNAVMSAFVLTKFSDLITQGVRTDKGFKDCHVNAVAKELQAFIGQQVTGTHVYNHLRKMACQVDQDMQAEGTEWRQLG